MGRGGHMAVQHPAHDVRMVPGPDWCAKRGRRGSETFHTSPGPSTRPLGRRLPFSGTPALTAGRRAATAGGQELRGTCPIQGQVADKFARN
eukprot:1480541-Rhodomonas_salina.2